MLFFGAHGKSGLNWSAKFHSQIHDARSFEKCWSRTSKTFRFASKPPEALIIWIPTITSKTSNFLPDRCGSAKNSSISQKWPNTVQCQLWTHKKNCVYKCPPTLMSFVFIQLLRRRSPSLFVTTETVELLSDCSIFCT